MMTSFAQTLLKGYRYFVSPWLGNNCRFYPSCTEYSLQCYKKHNSIYASLLTLKRLLRCHPFSKGGVDYPPVHKEI